MSGDTEPTLSIGDATARHNASHADDHQISSRPIFLVDLLKGLWLTLKYTPQPAFTFQYPAERRPTAPRFRGVLRLQTEPATGAQTCIVCDQCAKACPDDLIALGGHREPGQKIKVLDYFDFNLSRCSFCGLCAEVCPTKPIKALIMSEDYELGSYSRDTQILRVDQMYDGVADRAVHALKYFSFSESVCRVHRSIHAVTRTRPDSCSGREFASHWVFLEGSCAALPCRRGVGSRRGCVVRHSRRRHAALAGGRNPASAWRYPVLREGRFLDSLDAYRNALKAAPADSVRRPRMGVIAVRAAGRRVRPRARRSREAVPVRPRRRRRRWRCTAMRSGRSGLFQEAEQKYKDALAAAPDLARGHHGMARGRSPRAATSTRR